MITIARTLPSTVLITAPAGSKRRPSNCAVLMKQDPHSTLASYWGILAQAFIKNLEHGEWDAAVETFDAAMKAYAFTFSFLFFSLPFSLQT